MLLQMCNVYQFQQWARRHLGERDVNVYLLTVLLLLSDRYELRILYCDHVYSRVCGKMLVILLLFEIISNTMIK